MQNTPARRSGVPVVPDDQRFPLHVTPAWTPCIALANPPTGPPPVRRPGQRHSHTEVGTTRPQECVFPSGAALPTAPAPSTSAPRTEGVGQCIHTLVAAPAAKPLLPGPPRLAQPCPHGSRRAAIAEKQSDLGAGRIPRATPEAPQSRRPSKLTLQESGILRCDHQTQAGPSVV